MATADGGPVEVVRRLVDVDQSARIVTTDRRLSESDRGWMNRRTGSVAVARGLPPARLNLALGLRQLLEQSLPEADVLHIHAVDNFPSSIAARVAKRHGIPFILQPHGAFDTYHRNQNRRVKSVYLDFIDRRVFAHASAVVASSEREAEGIEAALDQSATIIPLGVDPALFKTGRSSSGTNQVLFLGRLTEKKSVDVVIRAFAASGIAAAGGRLVIAGPLDPRLHYDPVEIASDSGVEENIQFLGAVDREQRCQLLADSEFFLLPSMDESFGVAAAEALAAGCVVITTPAVGLAPDADRAGALVICPRDADAIGMKIAKLTADRRAVISLQCAAREYARTTFDWQLVSKKFDDLYKSVMPD